MQLDNPDLSGNIKLNVLDRFHEEINPINKLEIMKVLMKYKCVDQFGNLNDYLRDTFSMIVTKK